MYNRYVPQSDGTFRRNRYPDRPHNTAAPSSAPPEPAPPPCDPPVYSPFSKQSTGITGFLKQLLPSSFDTADLFILLLLLLMAGDNPEEKNNTLLTVALYFLM